MAHSLPVGLGKGILTTRRPQSVQSVVLIWIDGKVDKNSDDYKNTMQNLRAVINDAKFCREIHECVQFLNELEYEKALVITSGAKGQALVKEIHSMKQVHTIYVFCTNVTWHRGWTKDYSKVKDAYDDIEIIANELKKAVKESNENSIAIHFVPASKNADESDGETNRLEATFMYTKIFKNILLNMEHDKKAPHDLAKYCRTRYADNKKDLDIIDEFDQNYQADRAIWWYTRECFAYQMLNRALRLLEADVIVNMGFFIHDIHRQLEQLQQQQREQFGTEPFVLFRGQSLSTEDFEGMKKNRKGLVAFNNFLSTSKLRPTAMKFVDRATGKENTVPVLFVLKIDPKLTSITYANVRKLSDLDDEKEILFAMHTVFRIGDVQILDADRDQYEVYLTLSTDDDPRFRRISQRIEASLGSSTGWARVGRMLMFVGELNKAEELYVILLQQATSEKEKSECLNRLAMIKDEQGKYQEAKELYKASLVILQKICSSTDSAIAATLNNLGGVYVHMKEYIKGVQAFKMALEINKKRQPPNLSAIASAYNNIGLVLAKAKKNEEALACYNKALDIEKKIFDENDPSLAVSYNNIGLVYVSMGDCPKAISYFKKTLEIEEMTLAPYDPTRATSYTNISTAYHQMGENKEALAYLEKALTILNLKFEPTHPTTLTVLKSIEAVKKSMESP